MFDAYLGRNKINGKCYIGISKQRAIRLRAHVNRAKTGSQQAFHLAIKKYGEDAFTFEHIACAHSWEELKTLEVLLIDQYNSFVPNGYNMTRGGDGALGYKFTAEQLERLSLSHIGQERSPETRRKIGIAAAQHRHTEESRAKMRAVQQAIVADPEVRAARSAPLIDYARSEEGRNKSRQTLARIFADPVLGPIWQAGIAKGRGPKSTSTRANMSAARLAMFERNPEAKEAAAKLTRTQVAVIRWRLLQGEKQIPLAAEYGVRQTTISAISTRQIWKDVEPAPPFLDAAD